MAPKVSQGPNFPFLASNDGAKSWAGALVQRVLQEFTFHAIRLNQALPEDGTEAMQGPVNIATYAYAALPASPQTGAVVWISNANANTWGASVTGVGSDIVLAWYNGTAWTVIGK